MADSSRYSERVVLNVLVVLAAAVWLGIGGAVFLGIIQDVAGH